MPLTKVNVFLQFCIHFEHIFQRFALVEVSLCCHFKSISRKFFLSIFAHIFKFFTTLWNTMLFRPNCRLPAYFLIYPLILLSHEHSMARSVNCRHHQLWAVFDNKLHLTLNKALFLSLGWYPDKGTRYRGEVIFLLSTPQSCPPWKTCFPISDQGWLPRHRMQQKTKHQHTLYSNSNIRTEVIWKKNLPNMIWFQNKNNLPAVCFFSLCHMSLVPCFYCHGMQWK